MTHKGRLKNQPSGFQTAFCCLRLEVVFQFAQYGKGFLAVGNRASGQFGGAAADGRVVGTQERIDRFFVSQVYRQRGRSACRFGCRADGRIVRFDVGGKGQIRRRVFVCGVEQGVVGQGFEAVERGGQVGFMPVGKNGVAKVLPRGNAVFRRPLWLSPYFMLRCCRCCRCLKMGSCRLPTPL